MSKRVILKGQDIATEEFVEEKISEAQIPQADLSNYLSKTNTTPYTPTSNYHPATKKYVDDNAGSGGSGIPVGSIIDYDGNTVPEGFEEVTEPSFQYSTVEQLTGEIYRDGRPIYIRTFYGSTDNNAYTVMTTDYNNSTITIIDSFGSLGTNSGKVPLNSYVTSGWATGLFIHNEELQIYHGSSCRNGTYEVTIKFVKTSDLEVE